MAAKHTILILLLLCIACQPQTQEVNSFDECAAAGNPVMESYPRQCTANGQTFTENVAPQFHECTAEEKQAEICQMIYSPVCGMVDNGIRCIKAPCPSINATTFANGCVACSAQAYGHYEGACEDNTFVVCQATQTGFDPVQFAQDSKGICVEVCPGNYDEYVTQTGISLCIRHYGVDEIGQWDTCERSSESCDCVKAYETTTGDAIDDAQYRCVPEQYAERLLFRGGTDRLDENGQQSVMIA